MNDKIIVLSDGQLDFELQKILTEISDSTNLNGNEKVFYSNRVRSLHEFIKHAFLGSYHVNTVSQKIFDINLYCDYENYSSKEGLTHFEWCFIDDIRFDTVHKDRPVRQKDEAIISLKELSELLDTYEKRSENLIGESYKKGFLSVIKHLRNDLNLDS